MGNASELIVVFSELFHKGGFAICCTSEYLFCSSLDTVKKYIIKEILVYIAFSDQCISPTFCYPIYFPWCHWTFPYSQDLPRGIRVTRIREEKGVTFVGAVAQFR